MIQTKGLHTRGHGDPGRPGQWHPFAVVWRSVGDLHLPASRCLDHAGLHGMHGQRQRGAAPASVRLWTWLLICAMLWGRGWVCRGLPRHSLRAGLLPADLRGLEEGSLLQVTSLLQENLSLQGAGAWRGREARSRAWVSGPPSATWRNGSCQLTALGGAQAEAPFLSASGADEG